MKYRELAILFVGGLIGGAAVSFSVPLLHAKAQQLGPEMIRTTGVSVVDSQGRTRISLDPIGGISMFDENGQKKIKLLAEEKFSDIELFDNFPTIAASINVYTDKKGNRIPSFMVNQHNGKPGAQLSDRNIALFDDKGRGRMFISLNDDGIPSIIFLDANNHDRIAMGYEKIGNSITGNSEHRSEGSLVIFGQDGNKLWAVP